MTLDVQSVSRLAGARPIVEGVSFTLARGEVVAVLGPSGSGKTSLLRLLAGFDAPSQGTIRLQSTLASSPGAVHLPPEQRGLALAFQDATLFPHLDAVDNVALAVRVGTRAQRREVARRALSDMGLERVAGRSVASLSGGEAQRVALARAFVEDDRLLLLDEPFGSVDRLTRADLVVRLRARLPGCRAAVLVTHDVADALDLQARVLLMRDGRIDADGQADRMAAGEHGEWPAQFMRQALLAPAVSGFRAPGGNLMSR